MPRIDRASRIPLRLWPCLLCVCALLVSGAAAATPALAAGVNPGNALSELTAPQGETATAPTKTVAGTPTTESSGTSHTLILLALAAAVLLLAAIAYVIVRDARRVAPATDLDVLEARVSEAAAVRLRKRRAKAKAARKQRKRTR